MTQLVNIAEMSPAQIDLLQQQLLVHKQNMLQAELENLKGEVARLQAVDEIKSQQIETLQHRVDNFDLADIDGDPQQRLNKMIRKYAGQNGVTHSNAWKEFRQSYNTAYRTNLTMLIENFKLKNGVRDMTMPEFFKETGRLDDAIRVADKMLNPRRQAN